MKPPSKSHRFFLGALLMISTLVIATSQPKAAHAATGTVTGTITVGGARTPKGSFLVAFVQYAPGCATYPTGVLVTTMSKANGTFSQALDTAFSWRVVFRPMSSAPPKALWRLYKEGNINGVTKFAGSPADSSTCLTLTSTGASNISLETNEEGVQVAGKLLTSTNAPVSAGGTIYLSRTQTSYLLQGDGYVVRVGENGSWDISGVDKNQPNLYMQINLSGTLFSVKKSGDKYDVVPFDATCGDACKFSVGTSDITGIRLKLPRIGQISGVINGPSGPVGERQVCAVAYKDGGSTMNMFSLEAGRACTDSSGAYSLGLTFGSYRVQFLNSPGSPFKSQWYDQISLTAGYPGATVISLANGVTATRTIDQTLAEGKYIRGRVTDSSGKPIAGATINGLVLNPDTSMISGVGGVPSAADGTFSVAGIDPGTYMLMANHPDYGVMYLGGSRETATKIIVASNSAGSTGHDFVFARGFAISGTLSTGDGSEARICAGAYRSTGSDMGWGEYVGSNCFTAPGTWKLKGLKTGSYRIRFDAQSGNLRSIFLGGGTDYNNAQSIDITDADIENVNVTIPSGKSISGKIVNKQVEVVSGACVTAYKQTADTWGMGKWSGGSCTTTSGEFSIRGLEDGDYKLRIDPPMNSDYTSGYFTEAGNPSLSVDDAQTFTIGTSVSGLSQVLVRGPKFTAYVKDGTEFVSSVCMSAYRKVGNYSWGEWSGTSCSGIDGKISIRVATAGDYTFDVRPNVGDYQNGWYVESLPTSQILSSATVKTITSTDIADAASKEQGLSIALGNVALVSGKKAIGRIINEAGVAVPGICISAYKDTTNGWGEWSGSTCTQANGNFTLRGLVPAASYRFRVDVWAGDYKPGFITSSGAITRDFSSVAPLEATIDIPLGNVTVSSGSSISGIITSGADQPESNICITAHDATTLGWKASMCTQSNGTFSLRGLDEGSYKLSWWTQKPELTSGWYKRTDSPATQQVTSPEAADTLVVPKAGLQDIAIRLTNGAKIYGTITGSTSTEICVAAWTDPSSGTRDNAAAISCVSKDMKFELKGLLPTTSNNPGYYLQVFRKDGNAIVQDPASTNILQTPGGGAVIISVS